MLNTFSKPAWSVIKGMPAAIANQLSELKHHCGFADGFAADSEYIGNQILRYHQFVRLQKIMVYEQPTA